MQKAIASRTCTTIAAALLGLIISGAAHADKVGVAAAVNPDAFSSLNGAPKSQLNIGKSIFFDEHINTTSSGLVQVLLIDGSTFTVGPGSDLTIDKFVYDPKKKTGEMVATFSKGVMRFVGGKLSKNEGGVTVNTPQGALAIRGGMFMGQITGPKSAIYSFLYGVSLTLAGKGTIFEPGNSFYITGSGSTISPTTQAAINAMMAALTKVGTYNNAGTNPPTGPNPGQLTIQTNNYNEIINEATVQQIQDQIQKQLDAQSNPPTETPTTPTDTGDNPPPSTILTGYAAGTFLESTVTTSDGSPNYGNFTAGTLTNSSPDDVNFTFNSDQTTFSALFNLQVGQHGENEGGLSISFGDPNGGTPTNSIIQGSEFAAINTPGMTTVLRNNQGDTNPLVDPQPVAALFTLGFFGGNQTSLQTGPSTYEGPPVPIDTALCTNCDFLKWGGWLTTVNFQENSNDSVTKNVVVPLLGGWWVAGDIPTFDQLPLRGTATYDGTAVGNVAYLAPQNCESNWVTSVATGEVSMSWDFGQRAGDFKITDFQSATDPTIPVLNASGIMRIPGQLNNFSGPLLGNLGANGPAVSGSATGSFAANGLDKAAGIIGNFNIGNGNYKAAGIFGAGRTGNIDPTGHLNFNN